MMRRIWIVIQKEMLDNLRDRRSFTSAMITTLFMPVFMVAFIMILGKTLFFDPQEKPLHVPVQGAENAPGLMAFLDQNNVVIEPAPADPRYAVREGQVELVLVIPPDYGEKLLEGQPAPLQLVADSSRQSAMGTVERARSLLDRYNTQIAMLRLQARGVSPAVLSALQFRFVDVSTPESQTLIFLNMMPFLLMIALFSSGSYAVIDMTAGERERGSLEPLLINPVKRGEFVVAKILASLPFTIFFTLATLVAFGVVFNLVPLEEYTGFPMHFEVRALVQIFLLLLPVAFFAGALQMLVAAFTRSFKEAQTYLSLLPLFVGLPSAFLTFLPVKASLFKMLIPTFGQAMLIDKILRAETIQPSHVVAACVSTLVCAVALVAAGIAFYRREKILAGPR